MAGTVSKVDERQRRRKHGEGTEALDELEIFEEMIRLEAENEILRAEAESLLKRQQALEALKQGRLDEVVIIKPDFGIGRNSE